MNPEPEPEETPTVESEVINMPDAPVMENSQPQIIEAELKTPSEPAEAPTTDSVPTDDTNNMFTVRSNETGDKVYVIRNQKRYWVKNPETLAHLGFYLGKEKRIPFAELLGFPEGEPVDTTVPNFIYPWDKPEPEKSDIPTSPSAIWN